MSMDWQQLLDDGQAATRQGHHARAESLYLAAVQSAERFAAEDPRVATCLHQLARLYRTLKRFPEAEQLYARAVRIREKALGPGHPDLARSVHNLAVVYSLQNRYAEAEPLYRRALDILEQSSGADAAGLPTVLDNYARMLSARAEAIRRQSRSQGS